MLGILRGLLEPTATVPVDPYVGRRDNRTTRQKIISGVRIAAGLIAGFVVIVLALEGLSTLSTGAPAWGRYGLLFSWGSVSLATIIMFFTVNRWASIAPGFFFLPAFFKALGLLLAGPDLPHPNSVYSISRLEAGGLLALSGMVIALTWRFLGRHPVPTTLFDRLALTFSGLALIEQVVVPYHWPPLPLSSALIALFASWSAYRWEQRRGRHKHRLRQTSSS